MINASTMTILFRAFLTCNLLFICFSLLGQSSTIKPEHLSCEYTENPLGIDVREPRLGWMLSSTLRNQVQHAYEIIVSDNKKDAERMVGNVWSSGKVVSSESIQIACKALMHSFTRYYWRVRVYDGNDHASGWSQPAWFETALMDSADWRAAWITDGKPQPLKDEDFYKDDPMPLFRRQFSVHHKIESARLYLCGLGYSEAYMNGKKIGDHLLDPGFTSYRKQILYVTYDVTNLLKRGNNTIGIMLGNGWYNPLPLRLFGRFNIRDVQQNGRPCVRAQLMIKYSDGSTQMINTNEEWETAPGPVVFNSVYLGEHYDARKEISFSEQGSGLWHRAVIDHGPEGRITAQMQPAVKVTRILKPVRIYEAGRDTFLVDMGQNFAGVARIKVKGEPGRKIALRYGEDTLKGGKLNYFTTVAGQIKEIWKVSGGPGAPKTAWQEDQYILKGSGVETYSPRFSFHGFRYVEITGWPGKPGPNDIEGLRMNSDLEEDGSFNCSNALFNRLDSVIRWTFLSNVFSVQSDCPAREKMGYGGDMVATSQAFIYHYNMANFYRKAVTDFANDQQEDGGITEIAPFTGIADKGYGGQSGPLGWELAFPYLQKQLYDYYGDRRIIENNYEALKSQLQFLKSNSKDGLFYWDISDHEALDPKPESFSASAFYYHHLLLATEFAGILGQHDDSLQFAKDAQQVKGLITSRYWIPGTGRWDNATQSAQIFALYYRLSPLPDSTMNSLIREYERHNWHLSTGIFSTKMMFDVLREYGRNDLAYRIANQRDYPGWGYMLQHGATTLWETWRYTDDVYSQNHPMFGSVSEWFYKSLLGINSIAPGFAKIRIQPMPAGDLTWAKGSYQSIRGKIVSEWEKVNGQFKLHVVIPANTTAEIWLPVNRNSLIKENGTPVVEGNGMRLLELKNGYKGIAVGSGEYDFVSSEL